jgi:hypothetical protein
MSAQKFRKMPVVIEAMQLTPLNLRAVVNWVGSAVHSGGMTKDQVWLKIRTLEGTIKASERDWIIRGVQGEFYPCKPDVFAATYEAVTDEQG